MDFIHRLLTPKVFDRFAKPIIPFAYVLGTVALLVGSYWGLFIAPADYQQGDGFRIIYVHVPCALFSMALYSVMAISSVIFLVWRIKLFNFLAQSCAPIGAIMTALALMTGSIWGKPMWGTWWIWDARLSSELILLFLYLGYIALGSGIEDKKLRGKALAILAIIGFVDIPIIHYSVYWWQTLHQGATISKFAKPSMAIEMLYPLLVMILGFASYLMANVLMRLSCHIAEHEREKILIRQQLGDLT